MNIFSLDVLVDYLFKNPSIVLWLLLIYVFIYTLSVLFGGARPGRNPVACDARRPREPLVLEHKVRDAVLKQRFKKTKVPEKLDAVIIGSGAGGLSAAVLLVKAGKRVLVLEQHDQAGGCCHTFREKGFEFDTGIHYVGDMDGRSMLSTAVDQLTEGQLQWVPLDDAFDVVALGPPGKAKLYPMKSGREQYYENLHSMFPGETEAINKYRAVVKTAQKGNAGPVVLKMLPKWLARLLVATGLFNLFFGGFFKYANTSLKSVLDGVTSNKELRAVLSYILGDYGLLPSEAPFAMHSMLVDHYRKGAYYPDGGTSEITLHLVRAIEKYGSKVLVNAPVTSILFNDKGKAIGVRVTSSASGEVDVFAKQVISDAGARNTFKTLIPKEIAEKSCYYNLVDQLGPGVSCMTAFCGLSGSPSDLNMKASNYWAYTSTDIDGSVGDFMNQSVEDAANSEVPLIYISFPAAKDPSWDTRFPGKSVVLLITIAKWEWFSEWKEGRDRHRGERYEELKMAIGRQMWKQTVSLFPNLDGQLEYMEVGTPVTNKHYLGAPLGEMYGMNHGLERLSAETSINMRPATGIPGLYMTGQDVHMCGFVSAILGGMLCAGSILNRNIINDIERLRKTLNKQPQKKVN
ncbi:all-trans-retinol 13,14-reductase-like [Haliotis rufescens]|uniref:all-trans-retinol 13,14-reductase-like n=1 Tax=Haliotis rufescens TaxID=6454 RepID=UPI00201F0D12|nr:all-trans-retinol 13,14-reductase-like [Haliotis rufescens]